MCVCAALTGTGCGVSRALLRLTWHSYAPADYQTLLVIGHAELWCSESLALLACRCYIASPGAVSEGASCSLARMVNAGAEGSPGYSGRYAPGPMLVSGIGSGWRAEMVNEGPEGLGCTGYSPALHREWI